jgi:hypothetical protein
MEEITLNLIPTGVHPVCHVSQNDNERKIKINLVYGSIAYSIREDDVIKLNVRKPNDTVVSASVSSTVGNTYVIANITDDMCNIGGTNLCEIRIKNDDSRISSSNFSMEVEVDPSANGGGSGGATNLANLDDVNISNPTDGQVLKYNETSEMWENGEGGGGGGGGGHTIVDDGGTSLTQRTKLQFKGAYTEDNSTGNTTEVNVVREMTRAEFDLLSDSEKVGMINITDEVGSGAYHEYSTSEQAVGTWIDGSPVYEKTIYSAGGTIGNFSIPHNISSIDRVLSYSGTVKDSNFSQYGDIWVLPRLAAPMLGIDSVTATDIKIVNPSDFSTRLVDWYITLRYTKSST